MENSRDSSSAQRLPEAEFLAIVPLMVEILLQVPVRGEVDRREGDIAEETRARALVQPDETQLPDDVHRTAGDGAFCFRGLALHLQSDFPVVVETEIR